ncbi:hypothetical protein ACTOB_004992 [Actinoplanes oblitus]|uniref:Uncharacterized protein n=1 Tax=Actinoplanes oblitus TaxID=3040509 RepID=A0ABY8W7P5_9ACTN|nr:hypothetical protein [Actinoplanes oblitus]WIM93027.1 hypothetical protein ACTOB_004992 [Actinoplanes oblitus]
MNARLGIAAAAVLLFWAGIAYRVTEPPTAGDYRRTLVQVAATTHDAASTTALTARQQLDDRIFATFATSAYDDARTALAGAAEKLAAKPPPDDRTAGMRDRLVPLLQRTTAEAGAAATADDDVARRTAAERLDRVADDLDDLLHEWGEA